MTSLPKLSSPPATSRLELTSPAPVVATLSRDLHRFCRDQLTLTSWAGVSGRLTLATDHAQGQCQLTVNVEEKAVQIKDAGVSFLSKTWHALPSVTAVPPESPTAGDPGNPCHAPSEPNVCSCEAVDLKNIKKEPELGPITDSHDQWILSKNAPVSYEKADCGDTNRITSEYIF